MPNTEDPRIYFAAERTLLAWVRSSLAVIGLGFVVARFGFFLRLVRQPGLETTPHTLSTVIGLVLVALGSATAWMAAHQHRRYCARLPDDAKPAGYWTNMGVWFAWLLSATGVALIGYLIWEII